MTKQRLQQVANQIGHKVREVQAMSSQPGWLDPDDTTEESDLRNLSSSSDAVCVQDIEFEILSVSFVEPWVGEIVYSAKGVDMEEPPLQLSPIGKPVSWNMTSQVTFTSSGESWTHSVTAQFHGPEGLFCRAETLISCTPQLLSSDAGLNLLRALLGVGLPTLAAALVNLLQVRIFDLCKTANGSQLLVELAMHSPPPCRCQLIYLYRSRLSEVLDDHHLSGALSRTLEIMSNDETGPLVEDILPSVEGLMRHSFGNFVAHAVLEFGQPHHRKHVADLILADVVRLSKHRVASNVVRKALRAAPEPERTALREALSPGGACA
eukprot:CAMPEP_0206440034 /NCGR_PEP_ID=MMETSP0324_2-20121206/12544_1 /ASSEMBLY_ACC=CAM_ASM_000836 /TAXON_ID=2866 /ORGANISM="Crypthecodinium cohnii, Strain Seligo" /LENGTH=321 /DNA_ID=CAMNT_0053907725 /DNA_START=53 /DNA_END=1015 /DNA_ORIENTATION=-